MTSYVKQAAIVFVWLLCTSLYVSGKETACYKLINSSDRNFKIGAIQFISFVGDQCYESDVKGVSVKNGTLRKNVYQSNNQVTVFNGDCFCGDGAKFEFNKDKSALSVTSKGGTRYKFKRIHAPQGITTCSIVRNNNSWNNSTYYPDYTGNAPAYPSYTPSNGNTNNSNNNHNTSPAPPQKHKCSWCNGTGKITKDDNAPPTFGINHPRKQCPTCGKWYDPNVFNHYHLNCHHCGGTGIMK